MNRIKNPKVSFIEANTDVVGLIHSYFPEYNTDGLVVCPWHRDTKPSLHISEDGRAFCHACGEKAKDIVELVAKLEDLDYEQTKELLYGRIVDVVPECELKAYGKKLGLDAVEYLTMNRHLPSSVIVQFQIGRDPSDNRITLPIYDQFGSCVNIRRMGWLREHKTKALNIKGKGEVRLYPEHLIVKERRLLLVEGEWDMLCGRGFDLPTVTWTGGANGWNDKYTYLFADKLVWILYDNDGAGKKGARQVLEKLQGVAYQAEILKPLDSEGKDLTDWSFTNPQALQFLETDMKTYKFPRRGKKKRYCPMCGQEMK
jgi:DNA primase